jgi:uncharacterized membrane protein
MVEHWIALFVLACVLVSMTALAWYFNGRRLERAFEARLASLLTAEGDRIVTRVVAAVVGALVRADRERLYAARGNRPSR